MTIKYIDNLDVWVRFEAVKQGLTYYYFILSFLISCYTATIHTRYKISQDSFKMINL